MTNRTNVFIDASNLWEAQKVKGRFFDLQKLVRYLQVKYCASEIEVHYYAAYPKDGTRSYSIDSKHKFFTYLKKGLGFHVRKKPLKQIRIVTDLGEAIEEKGNMDVEIAIDVVSLVKKYDIAVLFTGDSDFLALVNYIRSRNKKVFIYSSKNNISRELRTGADGYIDVLTIEEDIWRDEVKHRPNKTQTPLDERSVLGCNSPTVEEQPLDKENIA